MTRFAQPNSADVRPPGSYSPHVIAILSAACDAGVVTRKQIAALADFSLSTAYRIVENGWEDLDQFQRLVNGLPEKEALELAQGVIPRFRVTCREADPSECGMSESLAVARDGVRLAETIHDADADRHRDAGERAEIQRQINEIRSRIDRLEAQNRPPSRLRA